MASEEGMLFEDSCVGSGGGVDGSGDGGAGSADALGGDAGRAADVSGGCGDEGGGVAGGADGGCGGGRGGGDAVGVGVAVLSPAEVNAARLYAAVVGGDLAGAQRVLEDPAGVDVVGWLDQVQFLDAAYKEVVLKAFSEFSGRAALEVVLRL